MMSPLSSLLQEAGVLAAVGGVGLFALWAFKRRAPATAPRATRPEVASLRALGNLLEELKRTNAWMVENLDRRAIELKVLLAEADQRLARLEALPKATPPVAPPPSVPIDPAAETAPELKAVFDTVYGKADHGKPLTEIARETGLSKGAVTLILGLRQTQRVPDGTHPAGPPR
jgi:hypothetical protein